MSQGMGVPPAVLVALGGILGAWVRYGLLWVGGAKLPYQQRHWATWGVNTGACFLMGLVVRLQPRWETPLGDPLRLALAVGFLGSMSTYSTLMAELVTTWQRRHKAQSLALAGASLLGGVLAFELGLALGQVKR